MMLTIFGLPEWITNNYLQKLIQEKCNIYNFELDQFLLDACDKKKVKISVTDETQASLVVKGLDKFKLSEHVLSVVPVPWNNATISQNNVNTTKADAICSEWSDNHVTSFIHEVQEVKAQLLPENYATSHKKKRKKRSTKTQRLKKMLLAKQAALKDSQSEKQSLEKPTVLQSQGEGQPTITASCNQLSLKGPTAAPSVSIPVVLREDCKGPAGSAIADQQTLKGSTSEYEPKQEKLEDPAPVSNLAKSFMCVAITCALTGHLPQEAADLLLDVIHMQLIEDIALPTMKNVPLFRKRPKYRDGTIKLFCANQNTLEWLQSVLMNLNQTGGAKLTMHQINTNKKILCGIVIPDNSDIPINPCDILCLLTCQNRWVDVDQWQFIGSVLQPGIYFMKVLIPKTHKLTLVQAERRLAYSLGSVYVKFLGRPII